MEHSETKQKIFFMIIYRSKNTEKRKKMRNIIDVIYGDTATFAQMMKRNLDYKELNAQGMVKKVIDTGKKTSCYA